MKYAIAFPAIAATVSASILARQDSSEQSYIDSVCQPNITTGEVAPCQAIIDLEEQCTPNGTSPLDYLASAECLCGGTFFTEWIGCQNCQYVHGARSEATFEAYESIISVVSNSLCTGTPTADFAAIFSSVDNTAVAVASGYPTTTSDQYPSETAIGLYYTGPSAVAGAITGEAAEATASATASSSSSSSTGSVTEVTGTRSASSSASTTAKSSSSSSGSSTSTGTAAATSSTGGATEIKALGGVAAVVAGIFAFM